MNQSEEYSSFENQVGGHSFKKPGEGFLKSGNCIYKGFQSNGRGNIEKEFYENIHETNPNLEPFIPKYYGIKNIVIEAQQDIDFIILDDLTKQYVHPCIVDIKVGAQTWDDDAPQSKIDKERSKYPIQQQLGFRFTGMRIYDSKIKEYRIYDKKYSYSLTLDTIHQGFINYLQSVQPEDVDSVVCDIVSQLEELLRVLYIPGGHRLICSSLLIIYEGSPSDDNHKYYPTIHVIDFGHSCKLDKTKIDTNFIFGLKRIIQEFKLCISK
ncbi:hypothetical protein WA158_005780 [Blastocystis sp. Blastoise]